MTSQGDETTPRPAGEDVADGPIIIERRDEFLTGEEPAPAGDGEAYGPAASDELVGRPASPDTSGMDPAPLVVPPETGVPSPARAEMAAPESAAPADRGSPETSSAPAALDEPGMDEPGMDEPGVPETPEPALPDPAAAAAGVGIPAAALSEQQWPAIQAMFVDDPKGSVQRSAAAADEVVKAFVASIEREQAALHAAWQNDATTEDLRTALQQYRAFCSRLEGLA